MASNFRTEGMPSCWSRTRSYPFTSTGHVGPRTAVWVAAQNGARRASRTGLCSLDQGAGGGARALPTRTLSREQHCSRMTLRPSVQRACFRGCARDMPHARNGAVQSHMRCEAVRMHLAPVLLHGELKKLDWAHKWRRRSVRGCGKSHDHDDDARLSWASPWAS